MVMSSVIYIPFVFSLRGYALYAFIPFGLSLYCYFHNAFYSVGFTFAWLCPLLFIHFFFLHGRVLFFYFVGFVFVWLCPLTFFVFIWLCPLPFLS